MRLLVSALVILQIPLLLCVFTCDFRDISVHTSTNVSTCIVDYCFVCTKRFLKFERNDIIDVRFIYTAGSTLPSCMTPVPLHTTVCSLVDLTWFVDFFCLHG